MEMQAAVNAARFHHQWLPDIVVFEPDSFNEDVVKALQDKGHSIEAKYSRIIGKVDAIHRDQKEIYRLVLTHVVMMPQPHLIDYPLRK